MNFINHGNHGPVNGTPTIVDDTADPGTAVLLSQKEDHGGVGGGGGTQRQLDRHQCAAVVNNKNRPLVASCDQSDCHDHQKEEGKSVAPLSSSSTTAAADVASFPMSNIDATQSLEATTTVRDDSNLHFADNGCDVGNTKYRHQSAANVMPGGSVSECDDVDDLPLDAMEQQQQHHCQDDDGEFLLTEPNATEDDPTSTAFSSSLNTTPPAKKDSPSSDNDTNRLIPPTAIANQPTGNDGPSVSSSSSMVTFNQADKKAVLAERSSLTRTVRRGRGRGVAAATPTSIASSNTNNTNTALAASAVASSPSRPRRVSDVGPTTPGATVQCNPLVEEKIGIAIRSSGYGRAASLPADLECNSEIDPKNALTTTTSTVPINAAKGVRHQKGKGLTATTGNNDMAPGAFAMSTTPNNGDAFHESLASLNSSRSIVSKQSEDGTTDIGNEQLNRSRETVLCERGELGLVVAVVVGNDDGYDEGNGELPAAVEFHPDAKSSAVNRTTQAFRRRALCVVVGLLVPCFLAIGLATAFWPRSESRPDTIRNRLTTLHPEIDFFGSHGFKEALEWITFDDPLQVELTDSRLSQRFLLAATYFATQSRNSAWNYCVQTMPGNNKLCIGAKQIRGTRWLSSHSECSWIGVICERELIRDIHMEKFGLRGLFPTSLTALDSLKAINLARNDLSGTIPSSLFALPLVAIRLEGNRFSGTIDGFNRFALMFHLDVSNNRFTGTIPDFTSKNLGYLSLASNNLTSTIPSSLGDLRSLETLSLSHNTLEGDVLPSIGQLHQLQILELEDNSFAGSIPESLFSCKELRFINLSRNRMEGKIDPQLWNLTKLQSIYLAANNFSGTLPATEQHLIYLQFISFSGNRFSGKFPESLCSDKELTYIEDDCSRTSAVNASQPECYCCSSCCTSTERSDCTTVEI